MNAPAGKSAPCPKCRGPIDLTSAVIDADGTRHLSCAGCGAKFKIRSKSTAPAAAAAQAPVKETPPTPTPSSTPVNLEDFLIHHGAQFSENFASIYIQTDPDNKSTADVLDRYGHELYRVMFINWPKADRVKLRDLLYRLANKTPRAEPIMERSWMKMLNEFTASAMNSHDGLSHSERLLNRLQEYAVILYDAHFKLHFQLDQRAPSADTSGDDPEERMETFKRYQSGLQKKTKSTPLEITCFYRGLVFQDEVKVVEMEQDWLQIKVDESQLVALQETRHTIIDSPLHNQIFHARVRRIDDARRLVTLTNILPYDGPTVETHPIRVQPYGTIDVQTKGGYGTHRGRLVDLSLKRTSVYVRHLDGKALNNGDDVMLNFNLPGSNGELIAVELKGKIVEILHDPNIDPNAHRIVFTLEGGYSVDGLLSPYITMRQSEILAELREARDMLPDKR